MLTWIGSVILLFAVLSALAGCGNQTSEPTFDVHEIRDFLDRNFVGTVWYSSVERFEAPGGGRLNVYTDLYPDAEGKQFAQDICRKIYANVSDKGVTEVAVYGQEGKFLVRHP